MRDEYLAEISNRSDDEVRSIISNFLISQGCLGIDAHRAEDIEHGRIKGRTEYHRRLREWAAGDEAVTPWEGMSWILDLLSLDPREAIRAIESYLLAHLMVLPDGRINGLDDAIRLIRAFYLGLPNSPREALEQLLNLDSRQFEHLIIELYHELGYETELTRQAADDNIDVIARQKESDGSSFTVYIECKRYRKPVGNAPVKILDSTVNRDRVNKGVLITTSRFTKNALALAYDRLELVSGDQLLNQLSLTFGRKWPQDPRSGAVAAG